MLYTNNTIYINAMVINFNKPINLVFVSSNLHTYAKVINYQIK